MCIRIRFRIKEEEVVSRYLILTAVLIFSAFPFVNAQEPLSAGTVEDSKDANSVEKNDRINSDEYSQYRSLGLSLGAAKVYEKAKGFSCNGYFDLLYENFAAETNLGAPSNLDQQVGVVGGVAFFGYRLNKRFVINSEIRLDRELVDNRTAKVTADLAYMDYFLKDDLVFRAGVILVPMGLVNEFHGPTEFLGTRRALGDIETIPSTWHALGFGIAGHKSIADYRVYLISGLNAAGFSIRGSRDSREISWDTIQNPAIVFRLDGHLFRGGMLGGSYYAGNSGVFGAQPTDLKVHTVVQEIHFEVDRGGWLFRAQYAKMLLDKFQMRDLNIILDIHGLDGIGNRMVGGYIETGFDLLAHRKNGTRLIPYMRVEETNPQDALEKPSIDIGLLKNLTIDHFVYTYGLEFMPMDRLVIKADYQFVHAEKVNVAVNQFNIAVSYLF